MSDPSRVLDLIDHAIADHLSEDAMRWTPDPSASDAAGWCASGDTLAWLGVNLMPWQARILEEWAR